MNIKLATQIINRLVQMGVRDFVCCAGARNAPIVEVLSRSTGIRVSSFYEERSASFFALGLSQTSKKPVVICTTSGTAVAETLPAVVEAYYTKTPLIVLSADRPSKYRGSGGPQAIEQVGIFSNFVEGTFDLELENFEKLILKQIISAVQNGPIHINVCFDEPLIDEQVPHLTFSKIDIIKKQDIKLNEGEGGSCLGLGRKVLDKVDGFLKKSKRPIVLLSKFEGSQAISHFINSINAPIFVEGTCDLDIQNKNVITSHELILRNSEFQNKIDSVIRIGSVPTMRFWRDLEGPLNQLPVLSISDVPFSGLSRDKERPLNLFQFEECIKIGDFKNLFWSQSDLEAIKNKNQQLINSQLALLKKYSRSEPALVNQLATQLNDDQLFFVGNSLPIREWDQFAFSYFKLPVLANRGANGIDGLISTFAGHLQNGNKQFGVCLIGDLSLKYDIAGLELLRKLNKQLSVVVVNNKGGQIFSRIFSNNLFENGHNDSFEFLAKQFGFEYFVNVDFNVIGKSHHSLLELIPDANQTNEFWNEWDQLWQ